MLDTNEKGWYSQIINLSECVRILQWCRRPDSNRDGLRHYPLKIACLPISPRRLQISSVFYFIFGRSDTFSSDSLVAGLPDMELSCELLAGIAGFSVVTLSMMLFVFSDVR